ncbi:SWIM-type domain-containing protein [Trichonephila clavipes]|nr:SWIM-type domain-containing protein [Trichonephila clavipes]
MRKGLLLFKEKFVSNIFFTGSCSFSTIETFVISAKVKAEMKKKIYYNPSVVITTDRWINNAKCTCPAGGSPAFCKHVFAVLYAIEDYSCKEMYSTSTERLQTWHQPKPCKTLPLSSNQTFGKSQNETKKD